MSDLTVPWYVCRPWRLVARNIVEWNHAYRRRTTMTSPPRPRPMRGHFMPFVRGLNPQTRQWCCKLNTLSIPAVWAATMRCRGVSRANNCSRSVWFPPCQHRQHHHPRYHPHHHRPHHHPHPHLRRRRRRRHCRHRQALRRCWHIPTRRWPRYGCGSSRTPPNARQRNTLPSVDRRRRHQWVAGGWRCGCRRKGRGLYQPII